jgi:DNA-binding transcriptional ArsR family regulator
LDATFGALADPTRRGLLQQLAAGPACVTDLARPHQMSLPAISRHLRVLEASGLVERQREGRNHRFSLRSESMREAARWLADYRQFWDESLDSLADYLNQNQNPKPEGKAHNE